MWALFLCYATPPSASLPAVKIMLQFIDITLSLEKDDSLSLEKDNTLSLEKNDTLSLEKDNTLSLEIGTHFCEELRILHGYITVPHLKNCMLNIGNYLKM